MHLIYLYFFLRNCWKSFTFLFYSKEFLKDFLNFNVKCVFIWKTHGDHCIFYFFYSRGNKTLTKKEKRKMAEYSDYIHDIVKPKKVSFVLHLIVQFVYCILCLLVYWNSFVDSHTSTKNLTQLVWLHRLSCTSGTCSSVQQNMTSDPGEAGDGPHQDVGTFFHFSKMPFM